jgi:hypothetical protein
MGDGGGGRHGSGPSRTTKIEKEDEDHEEGITPSKKIWNVKTR